ncbi:MAG: 16S rRNA (cytidine(1402)-2'-O)-methyltransferase [Patescibacteria group bacterium]
MSTLYVVGTPIGNLEDITLRALRIFKEVDYILCEDTRVTHNLLSHYGVMSPTISYHQHSGDLKIGRIIDLLRSGKNLALVTDAGTPGISDPGGKLVSMVREEFAKSEEGSDNVESVKIESVPGPAALTTAVSIAGAGLDRFLFLGFLPNKKGRQTMLKEISASDYPVIVYESKHRIVKLLEELEKFNEHKKPYQVTVCRELTKMFESLYEGSAADILAKLMKDSNNLKGEFVVIIKK